MYYFLNQLSGYREALYEIVLRPRCFGGFLNVLCYQFGCQTLTKYHVLWMVSLLGLRYAFDCFCHLARG